MQRSARLLAGMTLTLAVLGGCHGGTAGPAAAPAPETPRSAYVAALIDTLATHMATLELERAAMQVTLTPSNPSLSGIERRLDALRAQLAALPDAPSAEAVARTRILRALDERLAGLAVEETLLRTTLTSDNPRFASLATTVAVLKHRQSELRAVAVRSSTSPRE